MNRLKYFIIDEECDAVILSSRTDMYYTTGYAPDWGYYLYIGSGNYLLTDGRFTLEAQSFLSDDYTVIEVSAANVFKSLCELLSRANVQTVAYSSDMSYVEHCRFTTQLRSYRLRDISTELASLRICKASDEISCIIKAQRIAEKALAELIASGDIKQGVTERAIAAKLEYLMRINGSDGASFPTIVAFGVNSAYAHARPSDRQLSVGDIVLIDFGATFKGYCSDMTRTFVYKSASDEVIAMYNAVLTANITAIAAIKSGAACRDIDSIARTSLNSSGYGQYFNHSLGHGVGIEIHEEPRLSQSADECLKSNAVVTVEPGIYIADIGGVRIEDMVVVQPDGAFNITQFDKKLLIIE